MRIELKDVRKRFGRVEVLREIDAVIPSGQRIALVGPNGSGKSTLIRSLLGLIDCEGEVLLDGRSPFDSRVEVAKRLAYVPQIAPQMAASVEEILRTICTTRGFPEERIALIAARLELDLPAIRHRPFRNLSGGMKQKLLIATAFAARPRLLVLDEPTASLDARSRDRFFKLFDELADGATVVLCSHRLEELEQLATHVLALEDGKVTWTGPVDRARLGSLLEEAEEEERHACA